MDLGSTSGAEVLQHRKGFGMPIGGTTPEIPGSSPLDPEASQLTPFSKTPSKGRILIVDDDPSVRETMADLLEMGGYYTLQAADAAQALTILRKGIRVDVLVTDLTMPGTDGIELIRLAQELIHDLPAILLTGRAEELTEAIDTFHLVRKPVESQRLIEQLELLIRKPAPA